MTPSFNLLYPAIFVFTMLVIGLVLTVIDFQKQKDNPDEPKK
jgi:regulatory protein YycI of two-component signal transduction system YycFG